MVAVRSIKFKNNLSCQVLLFQHAHLHRQPPCKSEEQRLQDSCVSVLILAFLPMEIDEINFSKYPMPHIQVMAIRNVSVLSRNIR